MSARIPAGLLDRARKVCKRMDFHAANELVFLRPDGALDSCAADGPRAAALLGDAALSRSGYMVVGVYSPGAVPEQIAADAREVMP